MAETDERQDETTQTVRRQYEDYPYPDRDPEDERKRLVRTFPATLETMNHYCFRGRRDFSLGFRALFAGGGTGDGTIWLAEQLRDIDAHIVHLDISEASIEVARARADIRGLENITWMRGSLLDLPTMGLGPFDYIDCVGVLHHLSDSLAALVALRGMRGPMTCSCTRPTARTRSRNCTSSWKPADSTGDCPRGPSYAHFRTVEKRRPRRDQTSV